jgi:hypothetical protein
MKLSAELRIEAEKDMFENAKRMLNTRLTEKLADAKPHPMFCRSADTKVGWHDYDDVERLFKASQVWCSSRFQCTCCFLTLVMWFSG